MAAFIHRVGAFRNAGILSEGQSASLLVITRDVVVPATQSEDDATERDEN